MLRSKPKGRGKFDENSYRSPDRVNALRWENLDRPEYQAVYRYYRGLLAFRKAHEGLRQPKRETVRVTCIPVNSPKAVAYRVDDGIKHFLIQADSAPLTLPCPWSLGREYSRSESRHGVLHTEGQVRSAHLPPRCCRKKRWTWCGPDLGEG